MTDIEETTLTASIAVRYYECSKPLVIVGNGVRLSKSVEEVTEFINTRGIPVLTGINGNDIFNIENPNYFGRFGILGQKGANKILQEADFLIILGCRLGIRQIGYNFTDFARNAYKIHVDIDHYELTKKTLGSDLKINGDIRTFVQQMASLPDKDNSKWLKTCRKHKKEEKYRVLTSDGRGSIYSFMSQFSKFNKQEDSDHTIVTANGAANVVTMQVLETNEGQRLITNTGAASMGYGLPAAIGAYFASNQLVICFEGDGSIQMNIQELQTLKHHNIPMWLFVINNNGYNSIKLTQTRYMGSNFSGCDQESGVSFPDFKEIARAYGISYKKISNSAIKGRRVGQILRKLPVDGPVLIELDLQTETFLPKVGATLKWDGTFIPGTLDNMEDE